MTWFRVDDNLAFHPKVIAAGNPAIGLWVRAGTWAAQQLTDGYIPADIARAIGPPAQARALVDAGLWLPCEKGYEFHEWTERQPTRGEVEQRRKAGAERLRKWRQEHNGDGSVTPLQTRFEQHP